MLLRRTVSSGSELRAGRDRAGEEVGEDRQARALVRADRSAARRRRRNPSGRSSACRACRRSSPAGTCSPLFSATISLPSATVDVVMSRIDRIGRRRRGTPIASGLVDSRRSLPPNGATRCAPDVLRKCSDTWPAAAAISAQSPRRPEVPAVAQADHRDARLRAPSRCRARVANSPIDLAEAAVAVDDRDRVAVEHDRRRRVGLAASRRAPTRGTCRRAARRANRGRRDWNRRAAARPCAPRRPRSRRPA